MVLGPRRDLVAARHLYDLQSPPLDVVNLEKLRKRISELRSFIPMLASGELDAFSRVKYKLRRTVLRLTYDIHHLNKRLEKYRKNQGFQRSEALDGGAAEPDDAATEDVSMETPDET